MFFSNIFFSTIDSFSLYTLINLIKNGADNMPYKEQRILETIFHLDKLKEIMPNFEIDESTNSIFFTDAPVKFKGHSQKITISYHFYFFEGKYAILDSFKPIDLFKNLKKAALRSLNDNVLVHFRKKASSAFIPTYEDGHIFYAENREKVFLTKEISEDIFTNLELLCKIKEDKNETSVYYSEQLEGVFIDFNALNTVMESGEFKCSSSLYRYIEMNSSSDIMPDFPTNFSSPFYEEVHSNLLVFNVFLHKGRYYMFQKTDFEYERCFKLFLTSVYTADYRVSLVSPYTINNYGLTTFSHLVHFFSTHESHPDWCSPLLDKETFNHFFEAINQRNIHFDFVFSEKLTISVHSEKMYNNVTPFFKIGDEVDFFYHGKQEQGEVIGVSKNFKDVTVRIFGSYPRVSIFSPTSLSYAKNPIKKIINPSKIGLLSWVDPTIDSHFTTLIHGLIIGENERFYQMKTTLEFNTFVKEFSCLDLLSRRDNSYSFDISSIENLPNQTVIEIPKKVVAAINKFHVLSDEESSFFLKSLSNISPQAKTITDMFNIKKRRLSFDNTLEALFTSLIQTSGFEEALSSVIAVKSSSGRDIDPLSEEMLTLFASSLQKQILFS